MANYIIKSQEDCLVIRYLLILCNNLLTKGFQQMLSDQMNQYCYKWTTEGNKRTSGESTASDSSETASCRPYYLPETPAGFSSSQIVIPAIPSTWYAPCSSSASRVGDYSQSPELMDFYRNNQVTIIFII